MRFHGRNIDPVKLWSRYTDVQEGEPPFLPLCMCPNPEHDSVKPHFQINISRPLVHCFSGCGISGTYENAIVMIEGCTLDEAKKTILRSTATGKLGRAIPDPKTLLTTRRKKLVKSSAGKTLGRFLAERSYLEKRASDYLAGRRINSSSIARWQLGFDPDEDRILIPAHDKNFIPRFVIKRAITKENWPKYLYSKGADRQNFLFGTCHIDQSLIQSNGMILVEGSLDCIRMHQNGQPNTLGILGSSLSKVQARMIENMRPARVTLLFDRDTAGVDAIFKAGKRLPKTPIFIGRYPKGKNDPAELNQEEANRVERRAIPFINFRHRLKKEVGVG